MDDFRMNLRDLECSGVDNTFLNWSFLLFGIGFENQHSIENSHVYARDGYDKQYKTLPLRIKKICYGANSKCPRYKCCSTDILL
ncbi:hypothetical protein CEXT_557741 [Caerostris extrusa]|uniref:Uncharacterized protein n=1 Tax=Caerostris extrusa TaxID=172846 RepID=A0AAV4W6F2_CAEEX|nr:hypothetical protein CEXT_557741 [Caerostris extrusa]